LSAFLSLSLSLSWALAAASMAASRAAQTTRRRGWCMSVFLGVGRPPSPPPLSHQGERGSKSRPAVNGRPPETSPVNGAEDGAPASLLSSAGLTRLVSG